MESIPPYEGKPTVYLDQNVLDFFTKQGLGEFGQMLLEDYQVVYSDETLKEIRRSKGFEENFLNVLKDLKAYHLKLIVEQPNFTITDNATICKRDPYDIYKQYCESCDDGLDIEYAMQQSLFKFSGGRKGESLNDIHNEQVAAFSELMDSLMDISDELPEEIQKQLQVYGEEMTSQYKATLAKTENMMLESIEDDRNWDGIKDFRLALGIGPMQLNNIDPPDVLVKIWDKLRALPAYSQANMDIEDFFQLKKHPIYPEQPYFKHQKVTVIYNMLNTLGYYPDSKVHKERRFIAAVSDNSHASIASFCNFLVSNDEYFIKKVNAAYEYLEVPTIANQVVFNYA
ncbi:hypothetical protein [Idiomarina loihiensis]|jgi:hypothetical protein|uniref:Uncharacterized protein n=1 Tax=Idiomarina loihiensis (strain ATCC BAA-735 / DSM 15497 / L2-TR) TaxID=283942 RepID=Q5R0T1_IDILO|nr:hypothetical protein [Idiomarina loihiensis]AAV82426.1 Hypothetical protein IL1590 [Idiomarina loihiensis L2TR]AGM36463.1 hypothetical protein K734_08000 [Idiomarina loihiensis GSL 199]